MEKKTINDKICFLLLPIAWAFILLFCVLLFSFTSHAETYDNTLPFKYSGVDNYNTFLNDDLLHYIDNQNLPVYDENYVLILRDISYQSANPIGYRFYFDLLPINTFTSYSEDIYTSSVSFSIDSSKTKYRFYVGTLFTWNGTDLEPYQYGVNGIGTSFTVSYNLFGRAPITYNTGETGKKPNWTVSYFYPCYFSKDFYFNNNVVLKYTTGATVGTGHATGPINDENNFIHGLDGHRITKPNTPTINQYIWTTYNTPQIDTTNIESLLESIFNANQYFFSYLFTNLGGLFSNLINNLGDLNEYVVNSIYYAVNNIVSSIQDLATDFYNNMVSLFEPISEVLTFLYDAFNDWKEDFTNFADLFIHPFDEEEYEEQIQDCEFILMYDTLMANCEDIQEIFDNAEERDYFSLYISFENPLADAQHRIISSEINFDWLVPLRSVYRPFLWVFTIFELFVGSMRLLGNIIGGKAK